MSDPITNPYAWRPTDLEAIRRALQMPATAPAVRAINDAMAQLEASYPDPIPSAKASLDAIALIDAALLAPPPPLDPDAPPQNAVVTKVSRKGAAIPIPEQLPTKKLDVIEYATDLLMEEVVTEYEIPSADQAAAASSLAPAQQRRLHAQTILLILPSLRSWQANPQPSSYQGWILRG